MFCYSQTRYLWLQISYLLYSFIWTVKRFLFVWVVRYWGYTAVQCTGFVFRYTFWIFMYVCRWISVDQWSENGCCIVLDIAFNTSSFSHIYEHFINLDIVGLVLPVGPGVTFIDRVFVELIDLFCSILECLTVGILASWSC